MNKVQVRPDIFVKSAGDKMHINFKNKNFILTLGKDKHLVVFNFIELCDGSRTLEQALEGFEQADKELLEGFYQFLVQNKMVFNIADDVAHVAGTSLLTHAAQYLDSPIAAVESVTQSPLLVIGSGYSLLGAIKTIAQAGILNVQIINADELGIFTLTNETLESVFADHATSESQSCEILPFSDLADRLSHAHVLQVHDKFDSKLYQFVKNGAQKFVVQAVGHNGCAVISNKGINLQQKRHQPVTSKGDLSLLGATTAAVGIDMMLGIHNTPGYLYYRLDMTEMVGSAKQFDVLPLEDAENGDVDVINDFQKLCEVPLSPLVNFEQLDLSQQYLKVFQVTVQVRGGAQLLITGAGFNAKEAADNILNKLAIEHELWFSNERNADKMREQVAFAKSVHSAVQSVPSYSIELPKLSGKASYTHFSIISEFDAAVQVKRSNNIDGKYLFTVSVGGNQVHFSSVTEHASDALWEQALLELYSQCCAHFKVHSSVVMEVAHDSAA